MATKLKTSPSHLSLVPPTATFEPYYADAEEPWWACPRWCLGDCTGGGAWHAVPGSKGIVDFRMHERAVYTAESVDDVDRGMTKVEVRLERCDSDGDGDPFPADVVLRLTSTEDPKDWVGVRLTRAQRRELAAALLNADDLDDTAPATATEQHAVAS